jgi:hypothetical protein
LAPARHRFPGENKTDDSIEHPDHSSALSEPIHPYDTRVIRLTGNSRADATSIPVFVGAVSSAGFARPHTKPGG